jgi:Prenyltransferase and squalene oxidase repeat
VNWQVGAFAILAVALAGGFGWYERAHPDARIVALVGTLAAFAALGRIAFAALPNVKPTTDIVLVSGYALGGGPGFAVGALAGLASNFFFGQGPWTPWQMAGWGMVGVLGAGLAVVTRRRIARWPLALVCAIVGFGFTVLQDVGDWVAYSDHSRAALGVYVGKGIGFDCVHAGGCLLFALALGPALIRSLSRFAARLQVTWGPAGGAGAGGAGLALLLATVSLGWLAGQPGTGFGVVRGVAQAAGTPAGYLLAAQNSDGGFGASPGSSSEQLYAGWAALGLAAAGANPADVTRRGHDLLDYVRSGVASGSDPGSIERTILVAGAAGASPYDFGGRNLVSALQGDIRADGSVADQVNLTAFAILALRAAGAGAPAATVPWLVRQQDGDGGFNFAVRGGMSDVDDTGAALEALARAGAPGAARARARAVGFIRAQQDGDGGFGARSGSGSNAQSTAFAVQGLIAAGVHPESVRRRGASPLDYLRGLVAPDGHVRYSRSLDQTPVWVTAEALLALDGRPLPLGVVARRSAPSRLGAARSARRATRATHPSTVRAGASRRTRSPAASGPRVRAAPVHRRGRGGRARLAPSAGGPEVDRLAVDAAILTALALAPLGQD